MRFEPLGQLAGGRGGRPPCGGPQARRAPGRCCAGRAPPVWLPNPNNAASPRIVVRQAAPCSCAHRGPAHTRTTRISIRIHKHTRACALRPPGSSRPSCIAIIAFSSAASTSRAPARTCGDRGGGGGRAPAAGPSKRAPAARAGGLAAGVALAGARASAAHQPLSSTPSRNPLPLCAQMPSAAASHLEAGVQQLPHDPYAQLAGRARHKHGARVAAAAGAVAAERQAARAGAERAGERAEQLLGRRRGARVGGRLLGELEGACVCRGGRRARGGGCHGAAA